MKTIFFSLILMLVFGGGGVLTAQAQREQTLTVRVHRQKSLARNNLTIKFVSLVEDSRCAEGTRCVWAGNARIQVQITDARGRSQTFEMNTNTGAKGTSFGGYAVNLTDVEPRPRANVRINRNAYTATFSISRLTR
ncbi:MAG: hypothetical protein M3384_12865 [Acidobacteriota bacterium]|nr:hypothetical protein [Acidobacteriota bacterium]